MCSYDILTGYSCTGSSICNRRSHTPLTLIMHSEEGVHKEGVHKEGRLQFKMGRHCGEMLDDKCKNLIVDETVRNPWTFHSFLPRFLLMSNTFTSECISGVQRVKILQRDDAWHYGMLPAVPFANSLRVSKVHENFLWPKHCGTSVVSVDLLQSSMWRLKNSENCILLNLHCAEENVYHLCCPGTQ